MENQKSFRYSILPLIIGALSAPLTGLLLFYIFSSPNESIISFYSLTEKASQTAFIFMILFQMVVGTLVAVSVRKVNHPYTRMIATIIVASGLVGSVLGYCGTLVVFLATASR
jgi:hypothetical protein